MFVLFCLIVSGEGHALVRGEVLRHDDVVHRRRSPMRREVSGLNHESPKIGPGKVVYLKWVI